MHLPATCVALFLSAIASQPTIRATTATLVIEASSPTAATGMVLVENGTMYDVYVVSAATEVAESIEIRQKAPGQPAAAAVKEVPVPAFGRLEMSADGVHLALLKLKRSLTPGESIPLNLVLDSGVTLTVQAVVK